MKKISALLASLLAIVSTVSLLLLSACKSDPEKATQKDMIKHSAFIYDYEDGDDSHNFKLTMKKDNTFTLYIKDFENSMDDDIVMKTYTGTWSHVMTYEYEYRQFLESSMVFTKKKTDVLGIYLLEGYEDHYFGYHKSKNAGSLFSTNKTINEAYLESCREKVVGIPSGLGIVDLSGFWFKSEK